MTGSATESAESDVALPESLAYWRLDYEFTGRFRHGQPDLEPVFYPGEAPVVPPAPGAVITGTLVDCPEMPGEIGWVVVDTDYDTVAVGSPALRQLTIEHAPCRLELVAVPLQGHSGWRRWDWEAYELSPNGPRILVSEPHDEPVVQTAAQWAEQLRLVILPALEAENRRLEARAKLLEGELGRARLTIEKPTLAGALDRVKDQFLGPTYRQAKQLLQDRAARQAPGRESTATAQEELLQSVNGAQAVVARYERYAARRVLRRHLEQRAGNLMARHACGCESLERIQAEQSRVQERLRDGAALLQKLESLGTQPVRLHHSTLAATRHRSIPGNMTLL